MKKKYLFLLLILIPVALGSNHEHNGKFDIGPAIIAFPWFIGDTIFEIFSGINRNLDFIFNGYYQHSSYSIIFTIFILYILRKNNLPTIKYCFLVYYKKIIENIILLVFPVLFFGFSLFLNLSSEKQFVKFHSVYSSLSGKYLPEVWSFKGAISRIYDKRNFYEDIWFYCTSYLIVFFSIAFIYLHYRNKFHSLFNSLLLICFFPIISIGNNMLDYKGEMRQDARSITIYPLVHSLTVTTVSFYRDYLLENEFNKKPESKHLPFKSEFNSLSGIKLYSLFQIAMVLMLFPSLLITKEEKAPCSTKTT
jgi:hypothetical protein